MNPFQFGSVVRGEYFFDRKEETARVVDTLSGGNNLVLFAPRRYGKTSLVFRAMSELEKRGVACVYFDFSPIYDLADFCRVYARSVFETQKGWRKIVEKLSTWIRGARPKISLSPDGKASLELDFPEGGADAETLDAVLALPERIADSSRRLVVVFDEFQEISRFEKIRFEALLRSVVQRRENVSYLFLGSKTHMLGAMFTERSRPFFNSAATMRISKLPLADTVDFLRRRFRKTGVSLSPELARSVVAEADGVPYYVQLLAAEIWQRVRNCDGESVAEDDVSESVKQIIALKKDFYAELYDRLSLVQKKLARAIARDGKNVFSAAYAKRHGLSTPSSVQKALDVLIAEGIAEKDDAAFSVSDPFFRRFLCALP